MNSAEYDDSDDDDELFPLPDIIPSSTTDTPSEYIKSGGWRSKAIWTIAGIGILIPHLLFVPSLPAVLLRKGAPYVRTKRQTMDLAFTMIKPHLGPFSHKTFVDLGSGDGRAVVEAARKGFGKCIGYEINPFLYLYSMIKSAFFLGPRR
eukprot:TRINITY_DN5659_c0_g1_i1.p1 TRINITY_DN5659_c0_g1~~TRINITY_DN5659_c0_g1_i1.p1  ORF type:complete len:149 (-),score=33.33 TRINITY_DN5659_c0_g1_i1:229-675(-)